MKKLLVLAIVMMAVASVAQADTLIPLNDRTPQIVVGNTTDTQTPCFLNGPADCELQSLVDYLSGPGVFDVAADQDTAGMWALGGKKGAVSPVLGLEIAGDSEGNRMGIWSDANGDSDAAGRVLVDIFLGNATGANLCGTVDCMTVASLTFNSLGQLEIAPGNSYSIGKVNTGTYDGINRGAFGFYLYNPGTDKTWYSLDQLNDGSPQMLAFREPNENLWTIGFEDRLYAQSDKDFNDMLFQIESIVPIPEPGSMLLLGTGLFGLAGAVRRRMKK